MVTTNGYGYVPYKYQFSRRQHDRVIIFHDSFIIIIIIITICFETHLSKVAFDDPIRECEPESQLLCRAAKHLHITYIASLYDIFIQYIEYSDGARY